MSSIIKAEHLSYSYPAGENEVRVPAVRDLSLEIEEGSFVAILGRNGSGKSTLAKLLCMILSPDEGHLTVAEKDVTSNAVTEEDIISVRRDVGMVFQNPDNQIVATIVEEDVAFGCENLGLAPEKIRERVDWALDTVGMRKYARSAPHHLSGGQKQRVAIAGVIAMKRRCIIFDESTAMLDPMGRREVMETILRLNKEENVTVVLITHYMSEATKADRVIVMDEGQLVMDGSPEEVFPRVDELRRAGLDVPQTTELLYELRRAGYDVRLDIFRAHECAYFVTRILFNCD